MGVWCLPCVTRTCKCWSVREVSWIVHAHARDHMHHAACVPGHASDSRVAQKELQAVLGTTLRVPCRVITLSRQRRPHAPNSQQFFGLIRWNAVLRNWFCLMIFWIIISTSLGCLSLTICLASGVPLTLWVLFIANFQLLAYIVVKGPFG